MDELVVAKRDRFSMVLRRNRLVITAELLVVTVIQLFEVWGLPSIFVLFPFGWLSLWLRKSSWREIGLRRPNSWSSTIIVGVTAGIANALIAVGLIAPLVDRLGGGKEDLSQYASLPGNILVLMVWILIGWIVGGVIEEMVYRGYLLNRIASLFGQTRAGWAIGLLASASFFALGHIQLGISGVVQTFCEACFWAVLYLFGRRNLWLPIIGHGLTNTIAFVLIYLGLYPGMA